MAHVVTFQRRVETIGDYVVQTGHGFSAGAPVYRAADGLWYLAQADTEATLKTALVSQPTANDFVAIRYGLLNGPAHGLTPGTRYWLSVTTPGAVQTSAPSATGDWVQAVYEVVDTTRLRVLDERPAQIIELPDTHGSLYQLVASTAQGDPGAGNARLNQANPALATQLFIAAQDALNHADPRLAYLAPGDDLYLYDGAGNGYLYEVVTLVVNGALGSFWYQITVTNFRAAGVTLAPLPVDVRILGAKTSVAIATSFLTLLDTPTSYAGMATRLVKVNAAAVATEFVVDDKVPETRVVNTGAGFTGGGNLTQNRTLTPAFQTFTLDNAPYATYFTPTFNASGSVYRKSSLHNILQLSARPTRNIFRRKWVSNGNLDVVENDSAIEIMEQQVYLARMTESYDGHVVTVRFREGDKQVLNNQGNSGDYRPVMTPVEDTFTAATHYPMIVMYSAYHSAWWITRSKD
jgi:hypothetical protein